MTATRSRPPLDPRIRARRIEVRREQGRRRLRILLASVLAAALAGLGYALVNSALLDVDEVLVEGNVRTPSAEVVAASGLELGDPLAMLDVDGASAAIGRLPWVASARVDRSITGTVRIEVAERQPVATLPVDPAQGGGWVLVDREGRQLARVEASTGDHLVLHGVDATGVVGTPVGPGAQEVLRLLDALTPPVRQAVAGIGLDGEDLLLDLAVGGTVRMGDTSQLDEKLVSLETVLARVDLRCLAELDLGVPSAPALTRGSRSDGDATAPLSDLSDCS